MKAVTSKESVEGNEFGVPEGGEPTAIHINSTAVCINPAIGQERVIDYIAGDLTEDAHREFVDHVVECRYCLREIVLWRTAQVLAEEEEQPRAAAKGA
jgi:hypothetical protein